MNFSCPICTKLISVPDEAKGKRVRCPVCGNVFEMPISDVPLPGMEVIVPPIEARTGGGPAPGTKGKSVHSRSTTAKSDQTGTRNLAPKKPYPRVSIIFGLAAAGLLLTTCFAGISFLLFFKIQNGWLAAKLGNAADDGKEIENDDEPYVKPLEFKPVKLGEENVTVPLPGVCDDLVVGGGGRFVLCNLPALRKIALFDANEAKITHYFPTAGDNAKMAASMTKLIVAYRDTRIVQRWNLLSREIESTVNLPKVPAIFRVAMGSASNGPLFVGWGTREPFQNNNFALLDMETLQDTGIVAPTRFDRNIGNNHLRVSANGRVFGVWSDEVNPTGLQTCIIQGKEFVGHYQHCSVQHIAPGPNGSVLYTGAGLFNKQGRVLSQQDGEGRGAFTIPAVNGNVYLSLKPGSPVEAGVHFGADPREMASLVLHGVAFSGGRVRFDDGVPLDKRIICIPEAKLLVVVAASNDKLIINNFDVDTLLEKTGLDFLCVASSPKTNITPGKRYEYAINVKSKKGGVSYELLRGPVGLKIDDAGVVSWDVSRSEPKGTESVSIKINDKSGQEIQHNFSITVNRYLATKIRRPNPMPSDTSPDQPVHSKKTPEKLDPETGGPILISDKKRTELPALPTPLNIKQPPLKSDTLAVALPGIAESVIVGGGGRFLILDIPSEKQIAIFDVNEAKVVKSIPVAEDRPVIAAGMSKLFLVFPKTKITHRWDLLTLDRDFTATLTLKDNISGIGMGYGSDGPLVVQTVKEPYTGECHFFDIKTMKEIFLERKPFGHVHRGEGANFRGSADGRSFGVHSNERYPYVLQLDSQGYLVRSTDYHRKYVPTADGRHFISEGTLYDHNLKNLGFGLSNFLYPALQGPFLLGVPYGPTYDRDKNEIRGVRDCQIFVIGDKRPLATLPTVLRPNDDSNTRSNIQRIMDNRYFLIPDAELIVVMHEKRDGMTLHKISIDTILENAKQDYFFVMSTPVESSVVNIEYTYAVKARSRKGGVKYRIDSGPAGMKVSPSGIVTWTPPADFVPASVNIVMTISDATGQELFHNFPINVLKE